MTENILGVPPPPPPDVVPAIDTDVTGTKTIRDRLAKHRADPTCAECHRKIDPLGFSLESFDPVGRWRDKYPRAKEARQPAPKVDPSGELPSGETYKDFASFKKLIATTRSDLFNRHLIRSFLSYSTGRRMEFADNFIIDDLDTKIDKQGNGLKTLVIECLMSEIFRSR